MAAVELPSVEDLARRLGGDILRSGEILCRCPVHEADGRAHTPSCILKIERGRLIAHCRSERCDKKDWPAFRAALAAKAEISASLVGALRGTGPEGIRYDYRWPDGEYSWSKQRTETPTGRKSFKSGVWDDQLGWTAWTRPVDAVPLYSLPECAQALAADPDAVVLIVEGEKDVDTARKLGLPATTAADGGRWPALCTDILVRLGVRRVVVLPDNDAAGIQHGIRVADALQEAGITVAWLALPGLQNKGDLTDWVDAGGSRSALDRLLAEAPEYDPDAFQWQGRLISAGGQSPSTWRGGNDTHNIGLVLQYHPDLRGAFRFNLFRQRVEIARDLPWKPMGEKLTPLGYRAREDDDLTNLGAFLIADMDFAPFNIDTIDRAMRAEARKSQFDEAVVWLDRLPAWDGIPRVDTFLQTYFGIGGSKDEPEKTDAYLAMTSYMLFGQIVRRIHDPGCQADYSLLIYGNQGDGKDKALRSLMGVYLSELPPSLKVERAADRARTMAGYLLIHDAEMASFNKASPDDRKAALTRSHDKGRAAYAREHDDIPRRAPWAFTVNLRATLRDPTGDRRCWPTEMMRKLLDENVKAIKRDRLQVFAEAKARVAAGEPDWPDTPEKERLLLWGQSTFRPDAFGDLEQLVDRYFLEEPIRPKPAPGDALIGWTWKARNIPLTALTVGRFFEKVLGEVVGVGGGRHADRDSVAVVTVYLRNRGWTIGRVRAADVVADDEERRSYHAWRAPEEVDDVRGSGSKNVRGSRRSSAEPVAKPVVKAKRLGKKSGGPGAENEHWTTPAHIKGAGFVADRGVIGRSLVLGSSHQKLVGVRTFNAKGKKQEKSPIPVLRGTTPAHDVDASPVLFVAAVGSSVLEALPLALTPCPRGLGAAIEELYHDAPVLAMDVETSGLDADRDGIRTVQFCDSVTVAMVVYPEPLPAVQALEPLRDVLTTKRLVAHPARFEGAWLHAAGLGDVVLDDTALLWAAAHGGGNPWKGSHTAFVPIALRDLAKITLGIELDKEEQLSDWSAAELRPAQLQYAARDAVVTARIWDRLVDDAEARSRKSAIDVFAGYDDLRKSNALALSMERAGVAFDLAAHKAWTEATAREAGPLRDRIAALEPALVADKANSGKQLNAAIARRLEAMPGKERRLARVRWPRTPKGVDLGFSKDALADVLAAGHLSGDLRDLVQALHDLKALTGRLTLFGDGFRKHVGEDGRLRGHFYAAGAVTGRYVSQNPNLQNIFEDFRTYLVAPPGRVLVAADYSQLELRVLAAISRCPGMTAAFARGDDYHDAVARDAGVDRRQAKAINFGVVYGKGAELLARELGVDQPEAQAYLDRWAAGAPGAAIFLNQAPDDYARNGGIATARRWIDMVNDADASSKAGTRPRNYPIQGTAADVLHRAMALLLDRIPSWPGGVVPLLTVHDEIVLEVDRADADEVARLLPETMSEAFADILPDGPALHLVFGGVGDTWLSAKKQGSAREKAARSAEVRPKLNGKAPLETANAQKEQRPEAR